MKKLVCTVIRSIGCGLVFLLLLRGSMNILLSLVRVSGIDMGGVEFVIALFLSGALWGLLLFWLAGHGATRPGAEKRKILAARLITAACIGGLGYCIEKYVNGPIPFVIWEDGILKSFFSYAAAAIGIAAFALAEYKGTRTAE